jgi:hypothetical protein
MLQATEGGYFYHAIVPNGALSLKSSTKSSTLFRYLPSNACFSSVVLVFERPSLSHDLLALSLVNAFASLDGLRCSAITGWPADGKLGVSGMR